MLSLNVPVNVDFFEIADKLEYDDALEFIKAVDNQQGSYEFTQEISFFLLEEAVKCLEGEEVAEFKRLVHGLLSKYD